MADSTGVVAILIAPDGRVLASATDFDPSRPGGFSTREAQERRAKRMLADNLIKGCCAPCVAKAIDDYQCEEIVKRMVREQGFRLHIEYIGGEDD